MTSSEDASRLRSLLDIAKVVGAARSYDDLIELTAEEARRALDAGALCIARWESEQGVLLPIVNVGILGPGEVRFPTDSVFPAASFPRVHQLVQQRKGYVSTCADGDEEAAKLTQLEKDSAIAVPIIVDARVWGALHATRTTGQPRYGANDLDFAAAVATHVAAGVVQADHVQRIERLAFQDPLTGLANRRAVDDRLEAVLGEDADRSNPVSVVLADINRLKQVNDSFGHAAGDRLISAVGQAVSQASGLVPGSLAARIGGDEFAIVVTGAPAAQAVAIAEELCRLVDGQPMSTGVSCGVASSDSMTGHVDTPVRLLRLADAAQYRAKRAGLRWPVVAGQTAAGEQVELPGSDRRTRRGRVSTRVPNLLESGLALLDGLDDRGPRDRLVAVARHVGELVDAAGWWVSVAPDGGGSLVSLTCAVSREVPSADVRAEEHNRLGAVFELDEFPETDRAVRRAGSFSVELGVPGNDPAEEAALVISGHRSGIGAGATAGGVGWLVEVFADGISLPLVDLEPALRALVAVAVAGATGTDADVLAEVDAPRAAGDATNPAH